jgi:hypothetical protein
MGQENGQGYPHGSTPVMGRAHNSFTSYVGHAEETIDEVKVSLPEKDLWVAVLTRAVLDACKGPPQLDMSSRANVSHKNYYNFNRHQARHFFMEGGTHFRLICELAGRNPDYVQQKVRKVILRKSGWNVDVPVTSHYRQGPKRGSKRGKYRKKFRAVKTVGRPRKDPTMVMRGSKGGRPRLYVV